MPAGFVRIPNWGSWENQGGGIAVTDLTGNGQPDLIVFQVDSPPGANRGLYRIGRDLDAQGNIAGGWGPWIEIPDWFAWENQGGSVAVADLDRDGQPELVVFMIDSPPGQNQGYYRAGKKLDATGAVTGGWGPWIPIPDWFPWENQHGGIAVADLDNDGTPELIVMMVDNPLQANRGVYRVGQGLDAVGNVTGGWGPWIDIPDWFFWENQGAAIAVTDPNGAGKRDLIVLHIDNPIGQNQAFYKIGHDIHPDGHVAEIDWGPWIGVPRWSSWENQGGGAAVARLNGKERLLAFMIDNPPGENAGLYDLLDLEEDPAIYGQWEELSFHSGVLAVHTALLPGGKVLFYAGSGSSRVRFNSPRFGDVAQGIYISAVWDPAVPPGPGAPNFFHPPTLRAANNRPFDLFCGGDSFLPDGRLLSAGGTLAYGPFKGRSDVAVYNPQAQQWSFVQSMAHGRWYPTLVSLGDGRVLAASGLNEVGGQNNTIEIYSATTDTWQLLPKPQPPQFAGLPLYAHLFLMDDGRILFTGGRMDDERAMDPCILDITTNPVTVDLVEGLTQAGMRNQSASVILPPAQDQRIMILGGGPAGKENKTDAIDNVDIIDLKAAGPKLVPAAPMLLPRMHLNAVLLPDHTVFVSGGSLKQEDEPLARLQAEIYDPATNSWKLAARASVPRLYHSTAVLLADGRVVAAGGNPEGGSQDIFEPPDKDEEMRLEVYSPPYLFRGPRPTITSAPQNCTYGQTISIQSPQAGNIRWVSLVKNGVTTHSFDNSQRLVDLDIVSQTGGTIRASLTNNPNLAPPGWYMLFLVDRNDVPSVAEWIQLQ